MKIIYFKFYLDVLKLVSNNCVVVKFSNVLDVIWLLNLSNVVFVLCDCFVDIVGFWGWER